MWLVGGCNLAERVFSKHDTNQLPWRILTNPRHFPPIATFSRPMKSFIDASVILQRHNMDLNVCRMLCRIPLDSRQNITWYPVTKDPCMQDVGSEQASAYPQTSCLSIPVWSHLSPKWKRPACWLVVFVLLHALACSCSEWCRQRVSHASVFMIYRSLDLQACSICGWPEKRVGCRYSHTLTCAVPEPDSGRISQEWVFHPTLPLSSYCVAYG